MRTTLNGEEINLTIIRLLEGAKKYRYIVTVNARVIADMRSAYLFYGFPVFEYLNPTDEGKRYFINKNKNLLRSAAAVSSYVAPAPSLVSRFIGIAEPSPENLLAVHIEEPEGRKRPRKLKPETRIRYQVRRRSDGLLYAGLQHDLTDLYIPEGLLFTKDIDAAWLIVYKGYNPAEYAIDTVFIKHLKTTSEEGTRLLINKYKKIG